MDNDNVVYLFVEFRPKARFTWNFMDSLIVRGRDRKKDEIVLLVLKHFDQHRKLAIKSFNRIVESACNICLVAANDK